MGRITYIEGYLFSAPKDAILVHACNGQGVWGSGIALQFKKKYYKSYEEYHKWCKDYHREGVPYGALITSEKVGCLVTSQD